MSGLIVGGIVGIVTAIIGIPAALAAIGFSAAGVVAGSIAAAIQSFIGCVAPGSIFAILQSAGAAGISWLTTCVITSIGAVIGWIFG